MAGPIPETTIAPQPASSKPPTATPEPRPATVPGAGYDEQSKALRPDQGGYASQAAALSPRGAGQPGTVSDNLNLRASPSTDSEVLAVIPKGSSVSILESGTWSKISFGGRVGFGFGRYVRASAPPATAAPAPAGTVPNAADPATGTSTIAEAAKAVTRSVDEAVADTPATTPAPPGSPATAGPTATPTNTTEVPATAPEKAPPAVAPPAPVAPAATTTTSGPTAAATVTKRETTQYGPTPWIWNQWLPGNGGKASQEYKSWARMNKAANAKEGYPATLAKATKVQEDATRALEGAKKALADVQAAPGSSARALTAAQKKVTSAQTALDKANTALATTQGKLAAIDAEVAASQAEFKAWLKPAVKKNYKKRPTEWPAVEAQIDAYEPIQSYTQTSYTVTTGGQTVTMTDHTNAYSTELATGLGGKAAGDSRAGVQSAVDATRFGADDKAAMKAISKHEGTFSTTESYDVGGVTWGFLQWTTGKDGRGSVIGVLADIKAKAPAVFKARFQDYGIDVKGGALVVQRKDQPELVGADAVAAVRTDPVLSAAFAIAGTDPAVQNAQLEVAKVKKMDRDGMDRKATVSVGTPAKTYTFKASEIFTSEWGAAVVANAGVHAGPRRVSERLKSGLEAFFKANPTLDPTKPSEWAGLAETAIAPKMIGGDQDRATAFEKDGLSKVPGTYDGSIPTPAPKAP